jgi:hypothetical protein
VWLEFVGDAPLWLLRGLRLPYLRQFRSSSVRHSALVQFLSVNKGIDVITLGACGKSQACPIAGALTGLSSASSVELPSSCASEILINAKAVRFASRHFGSRDSSTTSHQLFRNAFPGPSSPLTTLHIDIHPNDRSFMFDIARSAPGLQHLTLSEKSDPGVRPFGAWYYKLLIRSSLSLKLSSRGERSRRIWNHRASFAESLLRLQYLDTLLLRTTTALVPNAGSYLQEHNVIQSWSAHVRREVLRFGGPKQKLYLRHPSLARVVVWYNTRVTGPAEAGQECADDGVLSWWVKNQRTGNWHREKVFIPGRDLSFC